MDGLGGFARYERKPTKMPPSLPHGGRSGGLLFGSALGRDGREGLERSSLIEHEIRVELRGSRRIYEGPAASRLAFGAVGDRLSPRVDELRSASGTSFLLERRQGVGPGVEGRQRRLALKVCGCPSPAGEAGRVKPLVECFVDLFIEPREEPERQQCQVVWRIESGPSQVLEGESTLVEAVSEMPKALREAVDSVLSSGLEQLGVSPGIAGKAGKVGGLLFETAVAKPLVAPLKAAATGMEVISAVLPAGDIGMSPSNFLVRDMANKLLVAEVTDGLDQLRLLDTPLPGHRTRLWTVGPEEDDWLGRRLATGLMDRRGI